MKHLTNIGLRITGVAVLLAAPLFSGLASAAGGTVSLSLSPSSGTHAVGSTLTVDVNEDSGTNPVFTVVANLNYSSNLTYKDFTDAPDFTTDAQSTGGGGVVKMTRSVSDINNSYTAVTGAHKVVTVLFTVNAGSQATVSFDNSSTAQYESRYDPVNNPNPQLVTYDISPHNAAFNSSSGGGSGGSGGGSGGGSSSGGSGSSSGSSKSSSSSASTLIISGISVKKTDTTATVTWKTSAPASSQVSYGLNSSLGYSAVQTKLVTSHSVALNPSVLKAGQTYYFSVKSVDAAHQVATSKQFSFQMKPGTDNLTPNQTPTPQVAAPTSSSNKTVAIVAVVVIAAAAVGAALMIRKMHSSAMAKRELESHIATPSVSGSINGTAVITPQTKNKDQTPPNGTVVG